MADAKIHMMEERRVTVQDPVMMRVIDLRKMENLLDFFRM
jgi:hypothetical protein